jgi:hypothetical protein
VLTALNRLGRRRWLIAVGLLTAVLLAVWGVGSRAAAGKLSARDTERALTARGYTNVRCAAIPNREKPFSTDTQDDCDYECSFRPAKSRSDVVLVGVDRESITAISP